jgi:hypothetical protein
MAGSKSNYLENRVINSIVGKSTTLTAPSTMWIALTNSTINDAWSPTDTGECAGANYTRFQFTNSTASNWTKGTTGTVTNKDTFVFSTAASTGWGTVRAFAIVDTSSTGSGNSWFWGDLTSPVVITAGNVVRFSTGTLIFGEL